VTWIKQFTTAFAGAKTWHQMQHLTKALIDPETSKIRSFREFKIEADKINKWYSKTALNAEYNTAIAGAQMASKWVEIQEQGDPMLEFDAVMDGQTTDLCRSLNGVTLPSSDPFWQQYYPPNHFACRSTVRISYGRTPTDRSTIVYPDKMPDMFKTNLAQTGVIFPPNHSYWNGVPKDVVIDALKNLPYDSQFSVLEKYGNGNVRIHPLVNRNDNDYETVYRIAKEKALLGHKIDILPTHQYDDIVRDILFHDAKKGKSIDLRIDGILWEVERSTNSLNINNLKHAVGAGSHQCDNVIVALSQQVDGHTLSRISKGRFIDHKYLKIIEYQYGENFVTHNREDFLK
jgi:SPP1 gp7 family putative phage head morphogenesis protein